MSVYEDITDLFALDQNPNNEAVVLDRHGVAWLVRMQRSHNEKRVLYGSSWSGARLNLLSLHNTRGPLKLLSPVDPPAVPTRDEIADLIPESCGTLKQQEAVVDAILALFGVKP